MRVSCKPCVVSSLYRGPENLFSVHVASRPISYYQIFSHLGRLSAPQSNLNVNGWLPFEQTTCFPPENFSLAFKFYSFSPFELLLGNGVTPVVGLYWRRHGPFLNFYFKSGLFHPTQAIFFWLTHLEIVILLLPLVQISISLSFCSYLTRQNFPS